MIAYRKKPDIEKTVHQTSPSKEDDPFSCILVPLIIGISYFVLSAIFRVTHNLGSKLDQVICYGALICFMIIALLGTIEAYQKSNTEKDTRERWAKDCKTALLPIVSRHEASVWWDDSAYRPLRSPNYLELEINSKQKANLPNETKVHVEVSQNVYDHLKARNTVRIYYMPEYPMTFLLEEEL